MKSIVIILHATPNESQALKLVEQLASKNIASERLDVSTSKGDALKYCRESNAPVLLLVSENYLKDENGLYLFDDFLHDIGSRLVPVVIPGIQMLPDGEIIEVPTQFETLNEVMYYRDWWYEEWLKLRRLKSSLPVEEQSSMDEQISHTQKISNTIGGFLRKIREIGTVTPEQIDYSTFPTIPHQEEFHGPTTAPEAAPTPTPVAETQPVAQAVEETPITTEVSQEATQEEEDETELEPEMEPQYSNNFLKHVEEEIEEAAHILHAMEEEPVAPDNIQGEAEEEETQGAEAAEEPASIAQEPQAPASEAAEHFRYGQLLLDRFGQKKDAITCFKRALSADKNFVPAWLALASLYAAIGKSNTARKCYLSAIKADPSAASATLDALYAKTIPAAEPEPVAAPSFPQLDELVLITGATSGIGRATALLLAQKGYQLILTGRRAERLDALKAELTTNYGARVTTLCFDVRNLESVKSALSGLPETLRTPDVLINNAGLAKGLDFIHEGSFDHWDTMIDTNIKGLLYMTRLVSPGMVARKSGQIINLCSTAGKDVYPKGNVYCATKFAVDALNKSMRMDLLSHGIKVTGIYPGHVEETEFALQRFDGDAEKAKIYNDFQPLKSSDVAETILFAITRPSHVNINEILLTCTQQASATMIDRSGRD